MNDAPMLKPCPFCGALATFAELDADMDGRFIGVRCTGCGCGSGKHYPLKEDGQTNAANEWNRRVHPELQIVAYITARGLRNWQAGPYAEAHILLRDDGHLRVPLYAPSSKIAA